MKIPFRWPPPDRVLYSFQFLMGLALGLTGLVRYALDPGWGYVVNIVLGAAIGLMGILSLDTGTTPCVRILWSDGTTQTVDMKYVDTGEDGYQRWVALGVRPADVALEDFEVVRCPAKVNLLVVHVRPE